MGGGGYTHSHCISLAAIPPNWQWCFHGLMVSLKMGSSHKPGGGVHASSWPPLLLKNATHPVRAAVVVSPPRVGVFLVFAGSVGPARTAVVHAPPLLGLFKGVQAATTAVGFSPRRWWLS